MQRKITEGSGKEFEFEEGVGSWRNDTAGKSVYCFISQHPLWNFITICNSRFGNPVPSLTTMDTEFMCIPTHRLTHMHTNNKLNLQI